MQALVKLGAMITRMQTSKHPVGRGLPHCPRGDFETVCNTLNNLPAIMDRSVCVRQIDWAEKRRAGGIHPRLGPLADQVPLKLGKDCHHMEKKAATGAGGVDCLNQRDEVHVTAAEALDHLQQIEERAAQTIHAPQDEGVSWLQGKKRSIEAGT